mgnify:CR=1 FL=1
MCFSTKIETPKSTTPQPVKREADASLLSEARRRRRRARGSSANIFTSALGDSAFGTFVQPARTHNSSEEEL